MIVRAHVLWAGVESFTGAGAGVARSAGLCTGSDGVAKLDAFLLPLLSLTLAIRLGFLNSNTQQSNSLLSENVLNSWKLREKEINRAIKWETAGYVHPFHTQAEMGWGWFAGFMVFGERWFRKDLSNRQKEENPKQTVGSDLQDVLRFQVWFMTFPPFRIIKHNFSSHCCNLSS